MKNLTKLSLFILSCSICLNIVKAEKTLPSPYNLNFEEGFLGELPNGWTSPDISLKSGYIASVSDYNPFSGKSCLTIYRNPEQTKFGELGSVMQSIDGSIFAGKKVKIAASVRLEKIKDDAAAFLWIRERRTGDDGQLAKMEDKPITSDKWQYYQEELVISRKAEKINYGAMIVGDGVLYVDDFRIEIIEDAPKYEINKELAINSKNLDYLKMYSKVYGAIRFFQPSINSINSNWEYIARLTAQKALTTTNDNQFKTESKEVFSSLAYSFDFSKPKAISVKDKNALPLSYLSYGAWNDFKVYGVPTKIHNAKVPLRDRDAIAFQSISTFTEDEEPPYFFAIWAKGNLPNPSSNFEMIIQFVHEGDSSTFIRHKVELKPKWNPYVFEGKMARKSKAVKVGFSLSGEGEVYIDNATFGPYKNLNLINNEEFEDEGENTVFRKWEIPASVARAGYIVQRSSDAYAGKYAMKIQSNPDQQIPFPQLNSIADYEIKKGLNLYLSNYVYVGDEDLKSSSPYSQQFVYSVDDAYCRVSTLMELYAHLYYFDDAKNVKDLDKSFDLAVGKVAKYADKDTLKIAIIDMLRSVNINQGSSWYFGESEVSTIPISVVYDNQKYVVISSEIQELQVGTEIVEILYNDKWQSIDKLAESNEFANLLSKSSYAGTSGNNYYKNSLINLLLQGTTGSKVNLKYATTAGESTIELTRNIHPYHIKARQKKLFESLDSGVVYFNATIGDDQDFGKVLNDEDYSRGLVLDFRGATNMSEYFLGFMSKDTIQSVAWVMDIFTAHQSKGYKKFQPDIKPLKQIESKNIIFLIDERTQGYSKSIVELAKHYKIGKIIGSPTSPFAGELMTFKLPGNYFYSKSVFNCLSPNKNINMNNYQISPDVMVNYSKSVITSDEVIENALKLVGK